MQKSKLHIKIKKEIFVLGLILLLGAYLRIWRISDYLTFLGDEGRDVLVVKRMIVDKKFTLLGPTASVGGFYLGPIYYYFMLPFLWLWCLDPTGPAVMVALFGIATIFLVFLVGKEFFDGKVGLIAASFYALSPLVVAYSHSSWNPNLVPFFALLYIYSLWRAIKEKKWFWLFLAGLSVGIGLQLHYLFSFLIPIGAVFILIFKNGVSYLKRCAFLILGTLVGWSPFLAFELRHRFPNTQTIIRFIFSSKETGFVGRKISNVLSRLVFRLFGRLVFNFPSREIDLYPKEVIFWWKVLIAVACVGALAALIIRVIKQKEPAQVLLLLWFVLGIGLFSFYSGSIYDYYLGILFPLPFFLVGHLFSFFWEKRFLRPLLGFSFLALLGINWWGRHLRFPGNRQLVQTKNISRFVLEKAEEKPFNFALITGQNSDHAYRYFLETWGRPPVVIENLEMDPERKTVTDQLLIVCEKTDCQPLGHSLWEVAGFGRAEIVGQWDVSVVRVYKLVHYQGG